VWGWKSVVVWRVRLPAFLPSQMTSMVEQDQWGSRWGQRRGGGGMDVRGGGLAGPLLRLGFQPGDVQGLDGVLHAHHPRQGPAPAPLRAIAVVLLIVLLCSHQHRVAHHPVLGAEHL